MNNIIQYLREELTEMNEIIRKKERALKRSPEGILRISRRGNAVQYYKRENQKDRNGKYIKKKDMDLVYKLAQKEYDKDVLKVAKMQKAKICRFLKQYKLHCVEEVYDCLSPERQNLVTPYILPQEEYIKHWENRTYTGKGFAPDTPEIYTEKGERVRSKSEKIIADKLKLMDIPYLYEYPVQLKGYGTVYPDFTLLNVRTRKEYYLEHFGKMDDASYGEKTILKIKTYERNGIFPGETLLMTYETASHPLDMRIVEEMLQRYLM